VIELETVKVETILGKIFGFSKEEVQVTITTEDATSGINYLALTLTPAGPAEATSLVMPENLKIYADGTIDEESSLGFVTDLIALGGQSIELGLQRGELVAGCGLQLLLDFGHSGVDLFKRSHS
jgi:hypothetical protein